MKNYIIKVFILLISIFVCANSHAELSKTFELNGIFYSTIIDSRTGEETGEVEVEAPQVSNNRYKYYKGIINIPSSVTYENITYPVTEIAESAFMGQSEISTVVLPATLRKIENRAFKGSSISSVVFSPNGQLTTIEYEAFTGCGGITNLNFPKSLITIGRYAFEGCSGIKSIKGGASIVTIDYAAFHGCENLTEIVIPNAVETIGEYTFWGCSALKKVVFGNSVKYLGPDAFLDCHTLEDVTLNDGLEEIGYEAFRGCWVLQSITIPNSVTAMGYGAFRFDVSLQDVTLSNNLKAIESWTFEQTALSTINIPNSVKYI